MDTIASGHPATSTRRKKQAVAVAAVVTIAAFALGPVLFTPAADIPEPAGAQLSLFVLLAGIEAAILGIGAAFAVFGRPAVRRLFSTDGRARTVHVATTWAMVSWWLHDNLHMVNGADLSGLLVIEYAFHVTLIVAVAAIAWALVVEARDQQA